MKKYIWCLLILFVFRAMLVDAQIDKQKFACPEKRYRPIPLWFWNNVNINAQDLLFQFRRMIKEDGYGGCAVLPFGKNFRPEYLSDRYFDLYKTLLEEAQNLGAYVSLYDEFGFPSGSMGAHADGVPRFMNKYPNATIKRLDKLEVIVSSKREKISVPKGKLMAVVAMDTLTKQRISLKEYINGDTLYWNVPEGKWKVMFFTCVKDGSPLVDYLNPESVKLFIKETHQAYYDRFATYFGNVIIQTFFDEPTLYRGNGRIWTDKFNEKFIKYYGESPELLYPALWYDIGPETESARNRLFGMRAILYAEGFMREIQKWAVSHGIYSTGHQDQEEVLNPVSLSGDLMLCGKYMDIPGIDKIGGNRPAERFYKVISSSAYNWDKNLVMSETFGAMGNLSVRELYHVAMEQYVKGINMLIPHAVWYDDKNVTFLPELSMRNKLYRDSLPDFNKFLSRLNYVLQRKGKHIADIAMIYPIETLQGEHFLDGALGFYRGGVEIPQTDYIQVSTLLTDTLGLDFTYLHPEVLASKCRSQKGRLFLDNKVNDEAFRVVIIPAMKTISLVNLKKLEEFCDKGGSLIFTTRLPQKSVEPGKDDEVKCIVNRLFSKQRKKGNVFFIESPHSEAFRQVMKTCCTTPDVLFPLGKELNYIHKQVNGKHLYYFANLKNVAMHSEIVLRGKILNPVLLNPHNGECTEAEYTYETSLNGSKITRIWLSLNVDESVFVMEE